VLHYTVGSWPHLQTLRLGWKDLPGTNAPAYYENASLTAVKSFIALAPVENSEVDENPENFCWYFFKWSVIFSSSH